MNRIPEWGAYGIDVNDNEICNPKTERVYNYFVQQIHASNNTA